VIVTIVPGLTFAARGRVLSPDGMPVSAVLVTVQLATERKLGNYELPETFRFDDGVEVRTGVDGSFRTPKELYGKSRRFRARVVDDGFVANQTDWVSSPGGDLITFPDLTLRRSRTLRSVSGRVVDHEGKGIAGISVFQSGDTPRRAATTTVAGGYFRLTGVPNVEAFVFAEKDGFRFGAASVAPGDERVEIRCATLERGSPP
jgi:Carboxypeptidase regulatory-like domain